MKGKETNRTKAENYCAESRRIDAWLGYALERYMEISGLKDAPGFGLLFFSFFTFAI